MPHFLFCFTVAGEEGAEEAQEGEGEATAEGEDSCHGNFKIC